MELLSFVFLPHSNLPGFCPVQMDTAASGRHLALHSSKPSGSAKHSAIGNKLGEESKATPYRLVAVEGYWNYSRSLNPAWYTSLVILGGSWSLGDRATIPSSLPALTTMAAISNSDIRTVSDAVHSPFGGDELSAGSFPWNVDETRVELLVAGMGSWADGQPWPLTRQQAISEAASRRQPRQANGRCGDNSGSRNKRRRIDNGSHGSDEGNDGGGLNRGNSGDGDEGDHRAIKGDEGDDSKRGDDNRYACPFHKRNPLKYGQPQWKRCAHPGWDSVHRFK